MFDWVTSAADRWEHAVPDGAPVAFCGHRVLPPAVLDAGAAGASV